MNLTFLLACWYLWRIDYTGSDFNPFFALKIFSKDVFGRVEGKDGEGGGRILSV